MTFCEAKHKTASELKFGRSSLDLSEDVPPVVTSSGQDEFNFGRSTPWN